MVPGGASLMAEATRSVSDEGRDDVVLPFAVEPLDLRGRIVRLGPQIDRILARHAYPTPVTQLLGEALALTALLGSSLEQGSDGRFQLQTKSDGPVSMIVVDFDAPDRLRAFARFDAERIAALAATGDVDAGRLLGAGHLAFTIDQGGDASRYQGLVALTGQNLEAAAHEYFRQSEQIPTLVRLGVAQMVTGSGAVWRAGGLLAQFLPDSPERRRRADLHPGDAPPGVAPHAVQEDDAWNEARALAGSVEIHELVDPTLSSERLLYRLFHERGVKVFEALPVREACRCSPERIRSMLRSFTPQERADMIGEDGRIGVTCEFCSSHASFEPAEFGE